MTSEPLANRKEIHRRPTAWAVAPRLVALICLPLLGLLLLGTSLTFERRDQAEAATDVQTEVHQIGRVMAARWAIHGERVPAETQFFMARFGLGTEQVKSLIGYDPAERVAPTRVESDRAVAALDTGSDVPARLNEVRSLLAAVPVDTDLVAQRYLELDAALAGDIDRRVVIVNSRARGVGGGDRVTAALDAIRAAATAFGSLTETLLSIREVVLHADQAVPLSYAIVGDHQSMATATAVLDKVTLPAIRDRWTALKAHGHLETLARAVRESTQGRLIRLTSAEDLPRFAELMKAGIGLQDDLAALNFAAVDHLATLADAAREAAATDLTRWQVTLLALVSVTVSVSVIFARSISRPLHSLAVRAAAISGGRLDEPRDPPAGPRDIAVAAEAMDDLVTNLRLLEAKAQALAACDFDDPVLTQTLPGRLGASLEQSVAVLSGSIDERERLQGRLAHQVTHDALTGLHNRAGMSEALDYALLRARRTGLGLAVVFIDLDDFKRANDTHGHAVGDHVLQITARRMTGIVGHSALLARLGGDDFMVLVEDVRSVSDVSDLARRLADAVAEPIRVHATHITLTASAGIAFAWSGEEPADQLLAWADLAVHRAKQRGERQVEIYDRSLQDELRRRAAIEEGLVHAIRDDELFLQYQPVIDGPTGRMAAVEALVRWDRPGHGVQPPDSFIPVAETSALIIDLDRWVLDHAARQLVEWQAAGLDLDLAVNISGRHVLSQNLGAHVAELIATTGIDPRRLILEITETVLVSDLVNAAAQLDEVRALGVRIAIDDFGTGFASITHLQQLPVDVLKIDRSFVQRIDEERDRSLLAMMCDLGRHLGLQIVAEGVENVEQLAVIEGFGCDHVQGYYFSRPLPPADLLAWAGAHVVES